MGWKRKMAVGVLGLLVLGAAGFFTLAPGMVENGQNATLPGAPVPSEAALALHKRLVIGDWHSDALLWDRDLRQRSTRGHVDLPRLRADPKTETTALSSPDRAFLTSTALRTSDALTAYPCGIARLISARALSATLLIAGCTTLRSMSAPIFRSQSVPVIFTENMRLPI